MDKFTIGLIGVGNITDSHLDALKQNPQFNLIGVCRRSEREVKQLAAQLGVQGFTDYHDLLAKRPDVALVSLPHGIHCQVTEEAMQAGCHVLVEKPMAVSVAECNRMLAAAKQHGKKLIVTESATFMPGAMRTGEKFRSGSLGRFFTGCIVTARAYFNADRPAWFLDPAMSGGGMFTNVGLHRLAVARSCLPGMEAVSVSASVSYQKEWQVEACTTALVKYREGGAMLYEEIGYYPKPAWLNAGWNFVFEEGVVSWDEKTWRLIDRQGKIEEEPLPPSPAYAPIYGNMLKALLGKDYWPHAREYAADTAIAQATLASSRSGREIDLSSPDWAIIS